MDLIDIDSFNKQNSYEQYKDAFEYGKNASNVAIKKFLMKLPKMDNHLFNCVMAGVISTGNELGFDTLLEKAKEEKSLRFDFFAEGFYLLALKNEQNTMAKKIDEFSQIENTWKNHVLDYHGAITMTHSVAIPMDKGIFLWKNLKDYFPDAHLLSNDMWVKKVTRRAEPRLADYILDNISNYSPDATRDLYFACIDNDNVNLASALLKTPYHQNILQSKAIQEYFQVQIFETEEKKLMKMHFNAARLHDKMNHDLNASPVNTQKNKI